MVIVGAGLAGLAAAHALAKAGVPFLVLERAAHAGGRVRTVRDRFADGAVAEVGAQAGGSGYTNWLALCEAYGVETVTEPGRGGTTPDALLIVGGRRTSCPSHVTLVRPPTCWTPTGPGTTA